MRFWPILCLLFVGLLQSAQAEPLAVGESAKMFALKAINADILTGAAASGGLVRLDDFVGDAAKEKKQAVLLTFFASWCEPCKREMPLMAMLYDIYRDKGLQILSVTLDTDPDKVEVARALAAHNHVKFPVLTDRFSIVARRYNVSELPCVYLLDAAGNIAAARVGYSADAAKQLLDETRKALNVPVSEPLPEALATYFSVHAGALQPTSVNVPPPAGPAAVADEGGPTSRPNDSKGVAKRKSVAADE